MKKINRRKFVKDSITVSAMAALGSGLLEANTVKADTPALAFTQGKLSYAFNALEPYIDAMTMEIHYTRHHAAYVKNVNDEIAAKGISFTNELDFFFNASKLSDKARNNGGGAWNHNLYFEQMKPGAAGPSGKIADALVQTFGSLDKFKEQFTAAALGRFGSGWAWLVSDPRDHGALKITSTPNQDNPWMDVSPVQGNPLLALDVWEHAYYLKYQNKRADYITNWWSVVDWDMVAKRLG